MRTVDEIVAKMRDKEWNDFLGTRVGDLVEWLPFAQAREWLTPEATAESWAEAGYPLALTDEAALQKIRDYMPFAWNKANNCRGLSACRSIYHMQAWLWLLGADEAVETLEHYDHYGKPQLRAICDAMGINWRALDDGVWRNNEGDEGTGPTDRVKITLPPHIKAAA